MALQLLDDERTTAFDAFVAELKRNKWLKNAGVTWSTWDDDPQSDQLAASDPVLPLVIVTARPAPSGWSAHAFSGMAPVHQADFFVDLDCSIDGTNQRQGMKFWRAIERAIFPLDDTAAAVHGRLQAGGISGVEIVQPGFGIDKAAVETGNQAFRGTFKLSLFLCTPVE